MGRAGRGRSGGSRSSGSSGSHPISRSSRAVETERILNIPINSINSDTDDLVDKYR